MAAFIGFALCIFFYKEPAETAQLTSFFYTFVVAFLGFVTFYTFFDLVLPEDFLQTKTVDVPTQA